MLSRNNNELVIRQGEAFTIDAYFMSNATQNEPLLLSSEYKNPYFVLTIASTKFEKNNRYVKSYWYNTSDIPKFYQTNIDKRLEDEYYINIRNNASLITSKETQDKNCCYKTKDDKYVYYDYNLREVKEYRGIRFVANFSTEETSELNSQNYMYQISIVTGSLMSDVLNDKKSEYLINRIVDSLIFLDYNYIDNLTLEFLGDNCCKDIKCRIEQIKARSDAKYNDFMYLCLAKLREIFEDISTHDMFNLIKHLEPNYFQADIDEGAPIGKIETVLPILQPTDITVINNLRILI